MSNGLVVLTVVVAVLSNEAKKLVQGKAVEIQPVIGGFVLGLFLFGMVAVNERVGRLFSILILVSALLVNGGAVFTTAQRAIGGTPTKLSPTTAGAQPNKGGSGR